MSRAPLLWLACVVVAATSGCGRANSGAAPHPVETPQASAAPVERSYRAALADIDSTILINGELRAAVSRELNVPNIRSGFASTVTYLAPEGGSVKQGDRILEFDASTLLGQKSENQRKLDEAKLKIDKTRADLEATRCDLLNEIAAAEGNLKVAQLYGRIAKDLLPANTFQKYQLDLEKAKLALEKAKEKLDNHVSSMPANLSLVEIERAQAEIDLKKIDGDLQLLEVKAPQDGIVIYGDNWANNRKIQVGDTLFPGMPVLTLPDLSTMQVVGFVYDTELRYVSTGMVCDLTLDAVPGKSWRGKIASLTSVASRKGFASQHKVFRAVVQPDAVDLAFMKPGMTVRVAVDVQLARQAVAVPREYVTADEAGRYFVWKGADPATASVERIKLGVFNHRLVQILEGVKAGDTIQRPNGSGEAKS